MVSGRKHPIRSSQPRFVCIPRGVADVYDAIARCIEQFLERRRPIRVLLAKQYPSDAKSLALRSFNGQEVLWALVVLPSMRPGNEGESPRFGLGCLREIMEVNRPEGPAVPIARSARAWSMWCVEMS